MAAEEVRLSLRVPDTVDVCGRRECVVIVDIGAIRPSDSLMGFNLSIGFNPEKLVFHAMLTSGTLAEQMDQRGFGAPYGEIRAYAFTLTRTVAGARPLVAFVGEYRTDCPDTTSVWLRYVEFNEEFERRRAVVVDTTPVVVFARAVDNPARLLRSSLNVQRWHIADADTVHLLTVAVQYDTTLRLQEAITTLTGVPTWLSVDSVAGIGAVIRRWDRSGSQVQIQWIPQGGAVLTILLRATERRDDSARIVVGTRPLDPCACLTRFADDTLYVSNTAVPADTVGTNRELDAINSLRRSAVLCVEPGERVDIYDLLGRLRKQVGKNGSYECFPLWELPAGVYAGQWQRRGETIPFVFVVRTRSVEFAP